MFQKRINKFLKLTKLRQKQPRDLPRLLLSLLIELAVFVELNLQHQL